MCLIFLVVVLGLPSTMRGVCGATVAKVAREVSTSYPEKLELNSLDKTVKLNAWIDLQKLTDSKIRALMKELASQRAIIETSVGEQGIPKDLHLYKANGYKRAELNCVSTNRYANPIRLIDISKNSYYKIKVVAVLAKPLSKPFFILKTPLDELFKATKLSEEDRKLIETHSEGLVTFTDFLQLKKYKKRKKGNDDILLLGNDGFHYRKLAQYRGFEVFETIYQQYYERGLLKESESPADVDTGPEPKVTATFMRDIASYDKVFFLPVDFPSQARLYRKKGGYTWVEWQWFKDHPEAMKNTLFVVGDEKSIGPLQQVQATNDVTSKHVSQIFLDPEAYILH